MGIQVGININTCFPLQAFNYGTKYWFNAVNWNRYVVAYFFFVYFYMCTIDVAYAAETNAAICRKWG